MGMSKDINNLIKEFTGYYHTLQKGYYKHGLNHKLSNAKQRISNRNQNVNIKFSEYWHKITGWVSKEMKK